MDNKNNKVLILDFGSQTTHLIKRRVEEFGIKAKIIPAKSQISFINRYRPNALILSGGPDSVYSQKSLFCTPQIFSLSIPILSVCYGSQLVAHLLNGKVQKGQKGEYGQSYFTITNHSALFENLPKKSSVWMSHFDEVVSLPTGFIRTGKTDAVKYASFENPGKKIYCVLFHPEVVHTQFGKQILENFLVKICGLTVGDKNLHLHNFVTEFIAAKTLEIKNIVGNKRAICALSGGVDSATAAALAYKAIGNKLICIHVDTGLMRQEETKQIIKTFKKPGLPLVVVKAEKEFLKSLKGVIDPEKKRMAIGKTFINVLQGEALQMAPEKDKQALPYLLQGTIYPDVIESQGSSYSHKIKSHHNVAGLPKNLQLKIIEPLRELYKDQVRELAVNLGLPAEIVKRQIFPGPGLAVRIIGEVTKEKLELLRQADKIVDEEIRLFGLYEKLWMSFAILTGVKTTGVAGDERTYGETIAVRAITSVDTMTADWAKLPYEVLARISSRITTEVRGVNRVVYDITTKPPATMEWE